MYTVIHEEYYELVEERFTWWREVFPQLNDQTPDELQQPRSSTTSIE